MIERVSHLKEQTKEERVQAFVGHVLIIDQELLFAMDAATKFLCCSLAIRTTCLELHYYTLPGSSTNKSFDSNFLSPRKLTLRT